MTGEFAELPSVPIRRGYTEGEWREIRSRRVPTPDQVIATVMAQEMKGRATTRPRGTNVFPAGTPSPEAILNQTLRKIS